VGDGTFQTTPVDLPISPAVPPLCGVNAGQHNLAQQTVALSNRSRGGELLLLDLQTAPAGRQLPSVQGSTGGDAPEGRRSPGGKILCSCKEAEEVPEEARKRCRRRVYSAQVVGTQPAPLPM
jgi:hypothetical protein